MTRNSKSLEGLHTRHRSQTTPLVEVFYSNYLEWYVRIVTDDSSVLEVSVHRDKLNMCRCCQTRVAKDVCAYLQGADVDFGNYALRARDLSDFEISVINEARKIPRGSTRTYSELAVLAGRPKAARAVGNVLRKNHTLIIVPCHRVVGRHSLGGFSSGLDVKRKLLRLEGSTVDN